MDAQHAPPLTLQDPAAPTAHFAVRRHSGSPFVYRADISATGWQWWWEHIRQSIMPVVVLGW